MVAYLQFGDFGGPYLTTRVEHKEKPLYHHVHGLQYTATGYGSKIPTRYMVKYDNRWYRVYSMCYSNVSTEYVLIDSEKVKVTFDGYGE